MFFKPTSGVKDVDSAKVNNTLPPKRRVCLPEIIEKKSKQDITSEFNPHMPLLFDLLSLLLLYLFFLSLCVLASK